MKGGGVGGVATLGAAGVEIAQHVLAETQSAVLQLVPYPLRCFLRLRRESEQLQDSRVCAPYEWTPFAATR